MNFKRNQIVAIFVVVIVTIVALNIIMISNGFNQRESSKKVTATIGEHAH
ncbi:hypothetical protein KFZ70_07040 [Tamlana fucoidanivorans]|nr:hypothetical protein [Tamlana fucoidanivorans]